MGKSHKLSAELPRLVESTLEVSAEYKWGLAAADPSLREANFLFKFSDVMDRLRVDVIPEFDLQMKYI